MMQSIGDVDFTVETKFQSTTTRKYQVQGLVVEASNGNFIRFDTYSDGSSTRFFAATATNGSMSTKKNTSIPVDTAYLRVTRAGATWTAWYSSDGQNWVQGTSFSHSLVTSGVGVMAGNAILEFRQYRDWPRDPRIFPPGPQSDASFLAGTVAAGAAGVVAPVLERGADPVPSQAARQLGYKGAVRIEAVVDATGRVARVRLVGSGHPLLVDAALVAAFEHVFRPGQAKGVAVPMVVVLELEFR
jgi:TonB family protein